MPFVKSLIEVHGGTLKINSSLEEGTSVVCTLPIKSKEKQQETEQSDSADFQEAVNS